MTDTPATTDTPPAAAPEVTATPTPAAEPAAAKPEPTPAAKPDPAPAAKAEPAAKPPTKAEPAKPTKTETKTVLDTTAEDDKPGAPPADWPDDWREKLAGDDTKMLATLKRYASPKAFNDAYFAMKQKLSSGEYKKELPENATEEELAEWRKENGIPEKPDGYDTTLADGLVIGEDDKPLVNEFLTAMHGANADPKAVKAALSTYYKLLEKQQAGVAEQDKSFRDQSTDSLRAEWGNDYRGNVNQAKALIDAVAPAGFKDRFFGARLADGRLLGDDPDALKFLVALAREVNPAASVMPGTSGNAVASIDSEIATIEKKMREDRQGYFKDEKMQARHRELLAAKEKLRSRAA